MAAPFVFVLYPPNSERWEVYAPELIFKHHPGELRGLVCAYVGQIFPSHDLKDFMDRYHVEPIRFNNVTHIFKNTFQAFCIEHKANPIQARTSYDKIRKSNIKERDPKAKVVSYDSEPLNLSDEPGLVELKAARKSKVPDEWYLRADEAFDKADVKDVKAAWKHKGKNGETTTVTFINETKRIATAIRDAKRNDTPIKKVVVTADDHERINKVVAETRKNFEPRGEPESKPKQESPAGDSLGEEDYENFKDRQMELAVYITPDMAGRNEDEGGEDDEEDKFTGFKNGHDVFAFFALKDDGIYGGETDITSEAFYDICDTTRIFEEGQFEEGAVDRYILSIMNQWEKYCTPNHVRKGFLTNLGTCMIHLESCILLKSDSQGPIKLEGWDAKAETPAKRACQTPKYKRKPKSAKAKDTVVPSSSKAKGKARADGKDVNERPRGKQTVPQDETVASSAGEGAAQDRQPVKQYSDFDEELLALVADDAVSRYEVEQAMGAGYDEDEETGDVEQEAEEELSDEDVQMSDEEEE